MGLVGGAVDQFGADQVGDLLLQLFGHENTPAERGVARIGKSEVGLDRGLAVPGREHAETVGEIFDRDLGAQLVEAELVGEALCQRARAVDQEAAAMAGRRLGDQEIHGDLALRRQQRAEPAEARAQQCRHPW